MIDQINTFVLIDSKPELVWNALTNVKSMQQWMGEPEMQIKIQTNWKENSPIIISGFHHIKFKNKGAILEYDPNKILKYTHLSTVSRLEDKPENYSVLRFSLSPQESKTLLVLIIRNFPTKSIFKHLEFYWTNTLSILKEFVETDQHLQEQGRG